MSEPLNETLERVRTFKLLTWPYHDIAITPYQMASIGYESTSLNSLECSICHHTVIVCQENYGNLAELLAGHQEECLYHGEQMEEISKEDLYLKMDDLSGQIKSSYGNSQNVQKNLYPVINIELFLKCIGAHRHTLFKILKKFAVPDNELSISFILQFMGWKFLQEESQEPNTIKNTLQCHFCGRTVDVSKYQNTEDDKQQRNPVQQKQADNAFDAVSEHRYFCLWTSGITGWEIYLQHLWDKVGESESFFKRERPEETQKIRVRLDGYLENFQIRTRELFEKVNGVMDECKTLSNLIEGQEEGIGNRNITNRKLLNGFTREVDQEVHQPLKKIKLN